MNATDPVHGGDRTPMHPRAKRRSQRGGVMIEITIVLALGGIVLGTAFLVSNQAATATSRVSTAFADLERDIRALAALRSLLAASQIHEVSPEGDEITISTPVPLGPGGSLIGPDGRMVWGTVVGGVPQQGTRMHISFQPQEARIEADLGRDLNGDGDTDDRFMAGRLIRSLSDGTELEPIQVTLYRAEGPLGDIDGDGFADPIFDLDGTLLRVNLGRPRPGARIDLSPIMVKVLENDDV